MSKDVQVLDIRASPQSKGSIPNLRTAILDGLQKAPGMRTLPSEILYDDRGLKIYNDCIRSWSEWYYPISAETEILEINGKDIARVFSTSDRGEAVLIELGAGSLDKTSKILVSLSETVQNVSDSQPPITYYALDLERSELQRTLSELQKNIGEKIAGKIATKGMWGTYDDGIRSVENNELHLDAAVPVHFLFLGGTIGNFSKGEGDVTFLRNLPLNAQRGDTILLGIDREKSKEIIERAYNFPAAREWIMNGLNVSGHLLSGDKDLFQLDNWDRYAMYDEKLGRLEAGYRSKIDQIIEVTANYSIPFKKDESVMAIFSNKYTDDELNFLISKANLKTINSWVDHKALYYIFSLRKV
ncbi:histidine-specific methyltransferase [Crucibulum laeve]|uniref:4-dimethylallyltryptophan N-methyltransferase n=1 Tax=Crucibulum laeve TaxID=68775 RepID=A0A5C3LZS5_9AGAR|nr:histidine-specific methyltransferase [Crucibulum laeve]